MFCNCNLQRVCTIQNSSLKLYCINSEDILRSTAIILKLRIVFEKGVKSNTCLLHNQIFINLIKSLIILQIVFNKGDIKFHQSF